MKKVSICSWIIVDEIWRILLIKRKYDKKYFSNYWSFPWGHHEEWETLEQGAIREVKEEVGLDFEIEKSFHKLERYSVDDGEKLVSHHYYLWKINWEIKIQEEECDGYAWFTYEETKNLKISNHTQDVLEKLYLERVIK